MAQRQYFDIKYPFTNNCLEKYELDLNTSIEKQTVSDLLHLLFTPKGQKLRHPEYGTDLIKFIFEINDDNTWSGIKSEIQKTVTQWIKNVSLTDLEVMSSDENGTHIYVKILFTILDGNESKNKSLIVEI